MDNPHRWKIIPALLIFVLINACSFSSDPGIIGDSYKSDDGLYQEQVGIAGTLAVQTMAADPALVFLFRTQTPTPTLFQPPDSNLVFPAEVSQSTSTETSLSAAPNMIPTQTPTIIPSLTPIGLSAPQEKSCSNSAVFITDVTIPDGTQVKPGEKFTKVWKIQNSGTCTWSKDYAIVNISGNQMGSPKSVSIGQPIEPGEKLEIGVEMVAPSDNGFYQGNWVLQDTQDNLVVLDNGETCSIWVAILVENPGIISIFDPKKIVDRGIGGCGPSG